MLRKVMTENGMVRGLAGNNTRITVFKGIPFAAPPVGDLRWKAPQPAANWEGVLDAYKFGPISMQDVPWLSDDIYVRDWHVDPEIDMDEDDNEQFKQTRYVLHVLGVIYPDQEKGLKSDSLDMADQDYKLKCDAYEKAYGKKLDYKFDFSDIAGLKNYKGKEVK